MFEELMASNDRGQDELSGSAMFSAIPGFSSRGGSPLPPISKPTPAASQDLQDELRQAKREIELLRSMDPFRAADMAIELQVEKMRVAEATRARDSAVQRLASAYDSIKEKAQAIGCLQSEKAELERRLADSDSHVKGAIEQARTEERRIMEEEACKLREAIRELKETAAISSQQSFGNDRHVNLETASLRTLSGVSESSSSSTAVDGNTSAEKVLQSLANGIDHLAIGPRPHSVSAFHGINSSATAPYLTLDDGRSFQKTHANSRDPADMVQARNAILSTLPVPSGIPDEVLKPIMIPPSLTIHEFLGNATGSLRDILSGYRAFHDKTTRWCPDREEHGYFLTPLYKCTTKPRVTTAHSWNEVDPRGQMTKPTECFYNREGNWYYAGQYVALRLEDLSMKEWETMDQEASSMLVKETVAARKNTSPTVHYEMFQLYAAGALKVACVGLQCVGFNTSLYRTIMDQADQCQQTGRWKVSWGIDEFPELGDYDNSNGGNPFQSSLFSFM